MKEFQMDDLKRKLDKRVNDYMSIIFLQSAPKRNLIEFRVGIVSLILGNTFALFLFCALSREKFILPSVLCNTVLLALVVSAGKKESVTQAHYAVTFCVTLGYGLMLFTMGDNTRGVIMFGLVYPILSVYILKNFWGNVLIAAAFASSLLCDAYFNPMKMSNETRSLYVCLYLMFWTFGIVIEKTKSFMETRMREQQDRLAQLASCDPLTKLYNRRSFYERLNEFKTNADGRRSITLLMLDVDNFKAINDTYGHIIGDEVLSEVAERVRSVTRSVDISCRWGGEEFLLLAQTPDEDASVFLAQKLCDAIGKLPFRLKDGRELIVTVSIGAVFAEAADLSMIDPLVRAADENLYRAKKNGKNRVEAGRFASPEMAAQPAAAIKRQKDR